VVQRWLSDALKHENLYADAMLENLYRWLCSPQSTLHDPALHRLLHKVNPSDSGLLSFQQLLWFDPFSLGP
jgi:hypothetical protein